MSKMKRILKVFIVVVIIALGSAIALGMAGKIRAANAKRNETGAINATEYLNHQDEILDPDPEDSFADIPVYSEEELLFPTQKRVVLLNTDYSTFANTNMAPYTVGKIKGVYPTEAVRQSDDNTIYLIYDTDQGNRLYVYSISNYNYFYLAGYPILIGEVHQYSEFSEIKPKDSISKVIEIDPIADYYKRYQMLRGTTPQEAHALVENGSAIKSIHYLSDGMLIINYDMTEDGDFIVISMEYSKDYILNDIQGTEINYRIQDCDLPN